MDETVKTETIFRIVSELTEALSVTNMPERLLDAAVDTISRGLRLDCCWVQMVTPGCRELSLSASFGFTPVMKDKMAVMDLDHPLGREVVGIGNTVIVPDLSRDGHFGVSLFEKAGLRSLIAVPIMTYRAYGIMGAAYKAKRCFNKDESDLLTAIAGVVGMALNKCALLEQADNVEKSQISANERISLSYADQGKMPKLESLESESMASQQRAQESQARENPEAHKDHFHRMRIFRDFHKARYDK